jgi:nucleotide-binding universal stress UspA family protein
MDPQNMNLETILAAVDFSAHSNNAAIYAANIADLFSSKLTLFNAYTIPVTGAEMGYIPPVIDMQKDAEDSMKKEIAELKMLFPDLKIDYSIKMGSAADLTKVTAEEINAGLIIIGIEGHGGKIKEHLIGTTSTYVLRQSRIPVLVIPGNYKFKKIENMGFACDFEDEELEKNSVLDKVKELRNLFGARLEILNVTGPYEEVTSEKENKMNFVEEKFKNTDHKTAIIKEKSVEKGLLELIKQYNMDLLIVNPKKHGFFHRLFSESETKKLTFHSPIPVLGIHG